MDERNYSRIKHVKPLKNNCCLVCHIVLGEDDDKLTSDDFLPITTPQTKFSDALIKFTNFKKKDIVNGSTQVCALCFGNADMVLSFIYLCNKSAENFKIYSQSLQTSGNYMMDIEMDKSNPFCKYDQMELCIACNMKIEEQKHLSINIVFERVYEQNVSLWDALALLSDYRKLDNADAPQHVCQNCFDTASSALRFHNLCNISVDREMSETRKKGKLSARRSAITETGNHDNVYEFKQKNSFTHVPRPWLQCRKCGQHFKMHKSLINHLYVMHKINFKCKICKKRFMSTEELEEHIESHDRDLFCKLCSKRCTSDHILRDHMRNHRQYEYFLQCWHCMERFPKKKQFLKHINTKMCKKELSPQRDMKAF